MDQKSLEWKKIRMGKITGTTAWKLLSSDKVIKELAIEKVAEKHSVYHDGGDMISENMARGNDLEPGVRAMIEMEKQYEIQEIGFVELDNMRGCSPDGLVGDEGGVEIKAPRVKNHLMNVLGFIDKKYIAQCQWFLFCTGRKWIDFASYCEDFEKLPLFITRIYPDEKWLDGMQKGWDVYIDCFNKFEEVLKGLGDA